MVSRQAIAKTAATTAKPRAERDLRVDGVEVMNASFNLRG